MNLGRNIYRLNGWTLDGLAGFRYMYLNDTLTAYQNSTLLAGGTGTPSWASRNPPAQLRHQRFVQHDQSLLRRPTGHRFNWVTCSKFDIGTTIKVAFGNTAHTAIIDGSTTLNNAGTAAPHHGGVYAQPSNIGQHGSNDFTVIPDLTLTFGYQIHSNIRLAFGYNLIYWPRVVRAGEQIERTIDPGQSPAGPGAAAGTAGTYRASSIPAAISGPRESTSASK